MTFHSKRKLAWFLPGLVPGVAVLIWIGWRSARRPLAAAVLAGLGDYAIVTGPLQMFGRL